MAVDVLLKGCLDKRAALQTMDKEPAVLSQAVDYLKRFANYEKALGLGNKGMRQVQLESKATEGVPSPDLRKVSSSEVPTGQQSGSSDQVLSQLENISKQLATLLSRSTSTRRVTPGNCFVCDKRGILHVNVQRRNLQVQATKKTRNRQKTRRGCKSSCSPDIHV